MSVGGEVLMLGYGPAGQALAGRLFMLHLRGVGAETIGQARELLRSRRPRAVLVHPPAAFAAEELRELAKAGGGDPVPLLAVGPRPGDPARLDALRAGGVQLAVWEPFVDGELRFLLNRAVGEPGSEHRREPRVPTRLDARVVSATGEKRVGVYNLSVGGAFLETTRPTGVGGRVTVRIALPGGELTLPARVRSANVPGNLQRPNLPLGMGVEFEQLDPSASAALAAYVEARQRDFRL